MARYVQNGERTEYLNAGTKPIQAGDVVVLPARIAVAVTDIPAGESGTISLTEAFAFPAAEEVPIGTPVYWDAAGSAVTKTETGNTRVGIAISDKADAAPGDVVVRLE